jgi:putative FmdB family regulatory protein
MGRPQLGFPRLRFVAVTAIGIAMALIILRRGALAFFFCPPPSTRPRIPVISPSQERSRMPHYEFFCRECKTFFDKILSLVDYEEGDVVCPHCGSKKVEQRWSAFSAITSKKSA